MDSSHGQDDTPGIVERKITSESTAGGRKVKASKDEPKYLVRSEKGGGEAVGSQALLTPSRPIGRTTTSDRRSTRFNIDTIGTVEHVVDPTRAPAASPLRVRESLAVPWRF